MATRRRPIPAEESEGEGWQVEAGRALHRGGAAKRWDEGTELLTYDNPFNQGMERVWFDGKIVYALELGEVQVDLKSVKVAQEYQVVYSVELDAQGKPKGKPEAVPGQYNIYDSVPGMEKYSPLWQFNYVVVPRGYKPNTLRSEDDCVRSGHRIVKSTEVEN